MMCHCYWTSDGMCHRTIAQSMSDHNEPRVGDMVRAPEVIPEVELHWNFTFSEIRLWSFTCLVTFQWHFTILSQKEWSFSEVALKLHNLISNQKVTTPWGCWCFWDLCYESRDASSDLVAGPGSPRMTSGARTMSPTRGSLWSDILWAVVRWQIPSLVQCQWHIIQEHNPETYSTPVIQKHNPET